MISGVVIVTPKLTFIWISLKFISRFDFIKKTWKNLCDISSLSISAIFVYPVEISQIKFRAELHLNILQNNNNLRYDDDVRKQ